MRIVKQIQWQKDPYRVGQSPNKQGGGGLPLKTLQSKDKFFADEQKLKRLENKIIEQGLRLVEGKAVALMEREVKRLSEKYREQWDQTLAAFNESVVSLAYEIATKICRQQINENPALVVEWIKESLPRLGLAERAVVKVHPSAAQVVRQCQQEIMSQSLGLKDMIIQEDSSIEPGGCVVEGDHVQVDATLKTRLKTIEQGLLGL